MFKNLYEVVAKELQEKKNEALNNKVDWLTELQCERLVSGRKPIDYYDDKIAAKVEKEWGGNMAKLIEAEKLQDCKIVSIAIGVAWHKSRVWGNNPQANVQIEYIDKNGFGFTHTAQNESKSISGCGYDKESTAIGEALDIPIIHSLLYAAEDDRLATNSGSREKVLGYGSGYGALPYFEGGVGFNSQRTILENLGFKLKNSNSGKSYDNYYFERID